MDAADIGTLARICRHDQLNLLCFAIDTRSGFDLGKSMAISAKAFLHRINRGLHIVQLVGRAGLDGNERLKLFFFAQIVAVHRHLGDHITWPFGHVHDHTHVFFVG